MPLQQTSGNVTQDAYGGGVAAVPVYVEDVMSTFLYTGNGSTRTITNGIDLAGKGGLVWIKNRGSAVDHALVDTARGAGQYLISNTTAANTTTAGEFTGFTASGFGLDSLVSSVFNGNNQNYASWTFRKQPKFFDVVTYTGNGVAGRTVAHNLGSVPGCVIIKKTSTTSNWPVYHVGTGFDFACILNGTEASGTTTRSPVSAVSATTITLNSAATDNFGDTNPNANGVTYVAYLFAHDAGGFGLTGTDNVISCGSYTGNGSSSGPTVTLGYEPQWVLIKAASITQDWFVFDNMRGFTAKGGAERYLNPNLSDAESAAADFGVNVTSTGFQLGTAGSSFNGSGETYIYIAIRRGPMKTPTSGTSVFSPQTFTGSGTGTTNFPVDLVMTSNRPGAAANSVTIDRLRGASSTANILYLSTSKTAAEVSDTGYGISLASNTSFVMSGLWAGSAAYWAFRRAPGFFDEFCFTGTGTTNIQNHNLGVPPELVITKRRNGPENWIAVFKNGANWDQYFLNTTGASFGTVAATVSATTMNMVGASYNSNGQTYVAYLFASCPGVSKVGSYTGNGSTQTISCGFTGGARFVLIKRTDSTGDWYVYDTARGMTTLTDPYLLLNSTAAESATLGSVTSVTGGFALNASILAAINTNAASYTYLAIS